MIVYRLTKGRYKNELSGKGAEKFGGRWNHIGVKLIYTVESRALCLAEIAVHIPLGVIPSNYFLQTIQFPSGEALRIDKSRLPKAWKRFPHIPQTKTIGDEFVAKNHFLVLTVPSAIVPDEMNFLINPEHPAFGKVEIVKIEVFKFDKRLFIKA